MYQDKNRNQWRVTWRDSGGRRRSKRFERECDAKLFELKLETGEASRDIPDVLTFDGWARKWLATYSKTRKHESQWHNDRMLVEMYLSPAFGERNLDGLRRGHLVDLMNRLRLEPSRKTGRPLSPKSINNIAVHAKKIMADAVDAGLIAENPFRGVKLLKSPPKVMQFWTIEEREQFIARAAVVDPAFTEAVVVACHTGLRLGELTALTVGDLDFRRGKILVRASYNHQLGKRFENTKGQEIAEVPMNQAVKGALAARASLPPEAPVFARAILASACHRLEKLCSAVGVRRLRFHDLRHTFASTLAMAGVDLLQIQRLMRHKSYQMTLRYSHLHPDHLRGATDILVAGAQTAPKIRLI